MREIPLTQGKVALVDDKDFENLNKHKWYALKVYNTYYATRRFGGHKCQIGLFMHREILKPDYPLVTDHIDRNGLNNQRSNLRAVTQHQNCQNRNTNRTSRYVGVCWQKARKKWEAQINANGKHKSLGFFDNEESAYIAYKTECRKIGCEPIC